MVNLVQIYNRGTNDVVGVKKLFVFKLCSKINIVDLNIEHTFHRWPKGPLYIETKSRDHDILRVLENHPKALPRDVQIHF